MVFPALIDRAPPGASVSPLNSNVVEGRWRTWAGIVRDGPAAASVQSDAGFVTEK
jgi:hypothetical protein